MPKPEEQEARLRTVIRYAIQDTLTIDSPDAETLDDLLDAIMIAITRLVDA